MDEKTQSSAELRLPPKIPTPVQRPVQSNVPADRAVRDLLKQEAFERVDRLGLVPPLTMVELEEHAARLLDDLGLDRIHLDYAAVLISNGSWRDTLARIPYERRLLLLPKCLRVEEHCPAPFDEFGLLCKECGLCSIQDFTIEAERLGYAVLVAEGSAIVRQMIETGKIEAVVGVSCLNVLEKSFPHMEAAAVPGIAIPLLQDDCIDCNVDLDWVWDVIHLTAADRTWRLDLDALRDTVRGWFTEDGLTEFIGPSDDATAAIARAWMARDGRRWRPYLATCTWLALTSDGSEDVPAIDEHVRRLAVAIECFHKASLIHDDVEDGDARRYDEPTLHEEWGEAVAINVGDYLVGVGYRLLAEVDAPADVRVEMLRLAAEGHATLARGQGRELLWTARPGPLSSLDVLEIFRQKTAPAFEVALRLGALLGGADDETHEALAKYSESLGIAYQIKDDLDDHRDGGDSNDLEAVRPSLLLSIAAKRARTDAERRLIERLWRRDVAYADVRVALRALLERRGAVKKATELLEAYEEDAVRSLRFLSNATLKGLLRRVVGKIFPRTLIEGYCSEFEARNAADREAGAEGAR